MAAENIAAADVTVAAEAAVAKVAAKLADARPAAANIEFREGGRRHSAPPLPGCSRVALFSASGAGYGAPYPPPPPPRHGVSFGRDGGVVPPGSTALVEAPIPLSNQGSRGTVGGVHTSAALVGPACPPAPLDALEEEETCTRRCIAKLHAAVLELLLQDFREGGELLIAPPSPCCA